MEKFKRGSKWNKWDLHVHTPKSIIQHYGGDTDEAWETFISDLEELPDEFKVLGINDYIFLDGYKKVKEYKNQGRLPKIELILPVIELRINKFASLGDEAWKKVNLHLIFSDQLSDDEIEVQFLSAIQHKIKISPDIEDIEFQGVATKENLAILGKQIKESSTVDITHSDLKVGFWNINFDYKVVMDIVNGYFKGKCLTAVGKTEWDTMRWDGSAAEKKNTINKAAFSFTSLEKAEHYHKHSEKLKEAKVRNFLLDCSDAHSFSNKQNEKDKIGNCFTWLKSDLTFEGLKQIANDKSRIFIGETPTLLERTRTNPTKFIDTLVINKIVNSKLSEKWFNDFNLKLNPSMVAIIGNKGQGKSAIADVIGLLGNTPNYENFSFLHKTKFRRPRPINKSEHFNASLNWLDGSSELKKLNENPKETSKTKIKYLPQNFLEKLCNEDLKDFEGELRNVIFSHLSEADKLGKISLDELIEYQSEVINEDVSEIKKKIQSSNKVIIELENKESENYRKTIEERLKEKENELKAHDAAKPTPIEAPTDEKVVKKNEGVTKRISEIRDEINKINENIHEAQESLSTTKIEIAEIEKVIQLIDLFEKQYTNLKDEIQDVFQKHSLNLKDSISLTIKKEQIADVLNKKQSLSINLNQSIHNDKMTGFLDKKQILEKELKELQDKLDEQTKAFQKYLDAKKVWDEKRELIIGSEEKDGTITSLKKQITYIENELPDNLKLSYDKRKSLTIELFEKKNEIIGLYKKLFEPITIFIKNYGNQLSDYEIELDVDLKIVGLVEKFFDHISLGSKGSFIGNPSGTERLKLLIENNDLKTTDGIISFLDTLVENLQKDKREDQKEVKREVETQLKKGYSVFDLYSYMFNLDYLEPEYRLKLGDKNLSELSPGERGALLLIFYLTLDQNDIPLVIDQPEENLDNQSVFKILVQFIKRAKEKRQIIIVTHNPNLAVACNAEQIVHVTINKEDGNEINIISGSLENPKINSAVINILEGTYPALNTRTNTYKVIERTSQEMGISNE
ncbi:MAG: DNA repair protein [Bacteroidetes bacterium]|nr:DNA repair protein [Bacteroidota bacterium]MBL7104590.1 DNA repair protein [Bacteroidales bacterium]